MVLNIFQPIDQLIQIINFLVDLVIVIRMTEFRMNIEFKSKVIIITQYKKSQQLCHIEPVEMRDEETNQ